MGTGRTLNKAPKSRPKKSPGERRRREKVQRGRLVAMGMAEDSVSKMTNRDLKDNLRRLAAVQPAV